MDTIENNLLGIHPTMPEENYHRSPGVSKTGLHTLRTKSPFHLQAYMKEPTHDMVQGSAIHAAVLEPHMLDVKFFRGPEDRRGNKWAAAMEIAAQQGKTCLTDEQYVTALRVRDVLQRNPLIQKLTKGAKIEHSAFWVDEEYGELVRCRPDSYVPDLKVIADLKKTVSAHPRDFAKSVDRYGYHMQDAIYSHGWTAAGGGPVDGFVFIAVEAKEPFVHAVYELDPRAKEEGWHQFRHAMRDYHNCRLTNNWPAYGDGVQPLELAKWAYTFTTEEEEEEKA